jgi:DNA invertase Pin-like site-specific DNA recombinase
MKAIAYLRVSTQGQVEDGVSMDAQEAKVKAWAELNGADSVQVFRDEGISGKRADNRPGLQAALAEVGKGDALICYSLSRLSRSTRDTLTIAEELQRRGGDLVSLSEKIDTTSASGKMVFRLLAVLAEFERDQVSDRTKFALRYKKERGEKTGGDVPFGYRVREGRLFKDQAEQRAIALIKKLQAEGKSLRAICRALEAAGISRKHGVKAWHPQTVSNIISREKTA